MSSLKAKSSHRKLTYFLDRRQWDEIEDCLDDAQHVYLGSGKTALHWACYYHAPPDIVELILNKYPDAALIQDKIGFTPLHYSTIFDDVDVMRILISASPRSVSMLSSTSGETPMHICMLRRSYTSIAAMLRVSCNTLIKENNAGETPLDYFFKDWYLSMRKLVNIISVNEQQQQQSETSTNYILQMDYVVENRKIQEIYDISENLLSIYERTAYVQVLTATEEPPFMLKNAFKNPSCPWVFCEFLVKFVLPHELEPFGNEILLFFTSNSIVQKTIYNRIFICNKCSKPSKELYDVNFGGKQCKHCADRYLKADSKRKICCDEELEKVQLLFTCLVMCPTICAFNSLS